MAHELDREEAPSFSPAALAQLAAHGWPGNVRELRNAVERAVARLPVDVAVIEEVPIDPFASPWRLGATLGQRRDGRGDPAPAPSGGSLESGGPGEGLGFDGAVADYESSLLRGALARARHNQRKAAESLGLGYHRFRRLLTKHGLAKQER
jgi:psp operon transcriptional activator